MASNLGWQRICPQVSSLVDLKYLNPSTEARMLD